jgi:V8-like Glu-specific endopeptidase
MKCILILLAFTSCVDFAYAAESMHLFDSKLEKPAVDSTVKGDLLDPVVNSEADMTPLIQRMYPAKKKLIKGPTEIMKPHDPLEVISNIENSKSDYNPVNFKVWENDNQYDYSKQCSNPANEYISVLNEIQNSSYGLNFLSNTKFYKSEFFVKFANAALVYDDKCLKKIQQMPEAMKNITNISGMLTLNDKPYCSALRISTTRILTARHCMLDNKNKPIDIDGFAFLYGDYKKSYKILNIVNINNLTGQKYTTDEDYIGLETETAGSDVPVYELQVPNDLAKVSVLGFRYYDPKNNPTVDRVRWSECNIIRTKGNCIYHGCQSDVGFSGAPLVSIISGKIVVYGLHVSGVKPDDTCPSYVSNEIGNLGIYINNDIVKAIAAKK